MSTDEERSPGPTAPETQVSVVVPVYNAVETLPACVEAVLNQEYPQAAFEAVFVDNRSTDDSLTVLRSFEPDIRVCSECRQGPSAARNTGARAARFDLLAFIDADCVPQPQWLGELVMAATESPDATIIGGPIVAWRPHTFAARFAERLFDQERAIRAPRLPYVISANMCTRKGLLERVGMFSEALLTGEDVDLSYRMMAMLPRPFLFAAEAVVEHVNPDSVGALWRKGLQHGRTVGRLADHHGQLRGETALSRLVSRKRYARIVTQLAAFSRATGRRLMGVEEGTEGEWLEPLYDAAFDGAKQIGLAAHLLSKTWRGNEGE